MQGTQPSPLCRPGGEAAYEEGAPCVTTAGLHCCVAETNTAL